MKATIFKGSGVAIITPMNSDFSINYNELGRLIDWQVENGTDAIIICGTTGESSTMTFEEHSECVRYTVERVNGRIPVIAGAGSNDTAYAVQLSKDAEQCGADALLHVTPYYNKTSPLGLIRHFYTIADATNLPVILYNVPARTGMDISPNTYYELSKHPNIVATKEANGNVTSSVRARALCGDDLHFYSGEDALIVPMLAAGGLGVISVLANIAPRVTHDICALYFEGKTAEASELQISYCPLIDALFSETNPIPVKHALNLAGVNAGPCRLPLIEMTNNTAVTLAAEMKKAGLLS